MRVTSRRVQRPKRRPSDPASSSEQEASGLRHVCLGCGKSFYEYGPMLEHAKKCKSGFLACEGVFADLAE